VRGGWGVAPNLSLETSGKKLGKLTEVKNENPPEKSHEGRVTDLGDAKTIELGHEIVGGRSPLNKRKQKLGLWKNAAKREEHREGMVSSESIELQATDARGGGGKRP